MNILSPLRWAFPYIPFLNKSNQDLLSSPVPIMACIHEVPSAENPKSLPPQELLVPWSLEVTTCVKTIHFSLDYNISYGNPKIDMKTLLKDSVFEKRLKETRKVIMKEISDDFCLRNLYSSKNKVLVKSLGQFINILKELFNDLFFKDADFSLIDTENPTNFNALKERIIQRSVFDKKMHEIVISSQAYQLFLERQVSQLNKAREAKPPSKSEANPPQPN